MALWTFPNPVNEVAARTVAAGVVVLTGGTVLFGLTVDNAWLWSSVPIAYGFVARVLTGPTLSPLGQFATRVVAPRIGREKLVPGPPKRFAQGIGAVLTVAAVVLLAAGHSSATTVLLVMVLVAATLESVFAVCIGCHLFALLMRVGLIPDRVCLVCARA